MANTTITVLVPCEVAQALRERARQEGRVSFSEIVREALAARLALEIKEVATPV